MATTKRTLTIYKTGERRTFGRVGPLTSASSTGSVVGVLDFSDATESALLVALGVI